MSTKLLIRVRQKIMNFKHSAYLRILCIILILVVVSILINSKILSASNLHNVLGQSSILAIAAVGQSLVMIAGGLDLSIGSVIAFTGVVSAILSKECGVLVGILIGILTGAVFGGINGLNVTKLKLHPVIATVAMLNIARGLTFIVTKQQIITPLPESYQILGRGLTLGIHNRILVSIILVLIVQLLLHFTKTGRHIYATGGNLEASHFSSIPTDKVKILTFVTSGVCAAIAGIVLTGRSNSGQPTIGYYYELNTIAAAVLGGVSLTGGRGNVVGTFFGAFIIMFLSNILTFSRISPYLQEMSIGVVIILAVLIDNIHYLKEVNIVDLIKNTFQKLLKLNASRKEKCK